MTRYNARSIIAELPLENVDSQNNRGGMVFDK